MTIAANESTDASSRRAPATGTNTARKVLEMLACFADGPTQLTARELAARLQLTESTAYRYLAVLKASGFLEAGDVAGHYRLGPMVAALSDSIQDDLDLGAIAKPVMRRICNSIQETVLLFRESAGNGSCVLQVPPDRMVHLAINTDRRFPLHRGAAFKGLLAHWPADRRERYLRGLDLDPASVDVLRQDLHDIRVIGLSESVGEIGDNFWAIAVPVHRRTTVIAMLTVVGLMNRSTEAHRSTVRSALIAGSRELDAMIAAVDGSPIGR